LRQDATALAAVRRQLAAAADLPAGPRDDATLRELAVLLHSHGDLFLTLE
jgi:hypothetical protein